MVSPFCVFCFLIFLLEIKSKVLFDFLICFAFVKEKCFQAEETFMWLLSQMKLYIWSSSTKPTFGTFKFNYPGYKCLGFEYQISMIVYPRFQVSESFSWCGFEGATRSSHARVFQAASC